ncbi:alpha/beta hydrolase [Neobacillus drentensis]
MEDLVDKLGINQFSIIGVSGGGAYAVACAYQFPDRVIGISLF